MFQCVNKTALAKETEIVKEFLISKIPLFFCIKKASLLNVTEFTSSAIILNQCFKESIMLTHLKFVGHHLSTSTFY